MNNNRDYINSKIECPVCAKKLAKNYLYTHFKSQHSNVNQNSEWYDKYIKKYRDNLRKNRELFRQVIDDK